MSLFLHAGMRGGLILDLYTLKQKSCGLVRKQKEMELEVLNGSIAGWEGSDVSQLGEIICMNLVHLGGRSI